MKIELTDFALKHFDEKSSGTKILNISPSDFEMIINTYNINTIRDGYAPFCKLLSVKNFTDAKVGSLPITVSNYQYLRSGYSSRREGELPHLTRWLELPIPKPIAEWLVIVLYDKDQMNIEYENEYKKELELYANGIINNEPIKRTFNADWGIVSILGQSHPNEEPMSPITIIRNAYMYGGSGQPIEEEYYARSVEFWSNNAILK